MHLTSRPSRRSVGSARRSGYLLLQAVLVVLAPWAIGSVATGDVSEVRKAVGQIVARGEGFESRGTGVWIKGMAGVVTNLHVVAATKEIELRPEVGGSPIMLKATKIWPSLDLVLLEPAEGQASFSNAGMEGRAVYALPLEPGLEVMSIGYPSGLGYSVSRGIVSGVRVFGELPAEYRRGMPRKAESRWVQTDCPINPGNSGGPLVTTAGEIVGINTWGSRADNDIFFALHIADVLQAIAGPGEVLPTSKSSDGSPHSIDLQGLSAAAFFQVAIPNSRKEDTGYLQLRTAAGSELLIDGVSVCVVPADGATLILSGVPIAKEFVAEVRKDGFGSSWRILRVPEVGVLESSIPIGAPLPTELTVASVPVDCNISLDGPSSGMFRKVAASQVLKDLAPGDYTIRAERDGRTVQAKVRLDPAAPVAIRFNLLEGSSDVQGPRERVRCRIRHAPLEASGSAGAYSQRAGSFFQIGFEVDGQVSGDWFVLDYHLGRTDRIFEKSRECGLERLTLEGLCIRAVVAVSRTDDFAGARAPWDVVSISVVSAPSACPAVAAWTSMLLTTPTVPELARNTALSALPGALLRRGMISTDARCLVLEIVGE